MGILKKYFLIVLFTFSVLLGCKEEKKDSAIEFLEKVASLKDYADHLKTPKAKEFKERVEKESKQYYAEFWNLVPEQFHVKESMPEDENSFYQFEKLLAESTEFDSYYDVDDYLKDFNTLSDFSEVEEYLKPKYDEVIKALDTITNKFEWVHYEGSYSKVGTKLRAVYRVLNLKFLVDVYQENWEDAFNTLDKHVILLNLLENCGGDIISRLLGHAAHKITCDTIIKSLSFNKISQQNIQRIIKIFNKIKPPKAENMLPALAYNLENAVKLCATTKVSPKEYMWMIFYPATVLSEDPEKLKKWFDSQYDKKEPFKPKLFMKTQVEFYELFSEDLKNVCHPEDMKSKKIIEECESTKMENLNNYFNDLYFGPMFRIKSSLNDVLTRNSVVELVAKIRLYEIQNGVLPKKLSVLEDSETYSIPKDLNSREPIQYFPLNREILYKCQPEFDKTIKF